MPVFRVVALGVFPFWLSVTAVSSAEPPAPAPPEAPAPRSAPVHPPLVASRLARDAIAAALRASGYPEARRDLASMATRARTSAALPELWLRASRSTDQSLRLSPTVDDPAHYSELGGAGVLLEARLIWHLDRLAFDRDELSVERLKNDRADAAAKLSQRVLETLFAWQKASLLAEDPNTLPEDRDAAVLKKLETEVTLDVLTAGWFGMRGGSGAR
jgi:hypothetical protein